MNVPSRSPHSREPARAQTLSGAKILRCGKTAVYRDKSQSYGQLVIPMRNRPALALWALKVRRRNQGAAIAHAPFEGVKMGRCLGLYFFGCGDIANMSQPSGDTAA
jgi:hypothetical protein